MRYLTSCFRVVNRQRLVTSVLLSVSIMGLSACGAGDAKPDPIPVESVATQEMDLDPMLVRVKNKDTMETETLEVDEVFANAYHAYQARKYEEAAAHYELIIKYFAESRFLLPSLYNGGLAYEQLGYFDDASRNFRKIIAAFPGNREATDAYYRLANIYQEKKDYREVVELMTQVMLRELTNFDRVEAYVRRSTALLELGELQEAEQGYRRLLRLNDDAEPGDQLAQGSHFIVQSHFGLGRINHARVSEIKLVLPPERMGEDLTKKAEHFLQAQASYIRALRYHHPHWSVAAGYMIGRLYEDFYADIFTAEIPDDLTEEELGMYFTELRKQIQPLMERAVQVYERNLSLSQRIATSDEANAWIAQTAVHLERLRAYLHDPGTQQRAQKLVLEGRDLSELWDPTIPASQAIQDAIDEATDSTLNDLNM